ncbi:hypothetical protein ACJJI5_18600 [Microbulbifer sp. EKSA008]|uniref:hypothetical protein n=1 Tax=unclassified Microbulbifer TaxID=2619833 RepID=UPI00403B1DAF
MKYIVILMSLVLGSCVGQEFSRVERVPSITLDENIVYSNAGFEGYDLGFSKPEINVPAVSSLNEMPPYTYSEESGWRGGCIVFDMNFIAEANLILDLKGVKETWTPIDGEPKKLYIFEVR